MKKVFALVLVFFIAVIFSYTYMKGGSDDVQTEEVNSNLITVNLYFSNKDYNQLIKEVRHIKKSKDSYLLKNVLSELLKGPLQPEIKQIIPSETKLIDAKIEGTVATVNFSSEFLKTNSTAEEIISRFSVVNTVCELPNINKVKLLVEGKEIIDKEGNPLGILGKDDIIFNVVPQDTLTDIKLYFSGSDGEYLVPEIRKVNVKEERIEKYIVEELIKGPKSESLFATVPPETELLTIEVENGTCFVNFSEEIITKHWGGSAGEIFTIYSIVNSLTEMNNIDNVQFLIEGKKRKSFIHMVFNEPFERDASLINDIAIKIE